jgi:hypothetical protein
MLNALLLLAATVADMYRSRRSLVLENTLLRHQLTVLQRSVAKPRVTRFDRIGLVALAAITPTWRNVLRIVQPETLSSLASCGLSGSVALAQPKTPHVAGPSGDGRLRRECLDHAVVLDVGHFQRVVAEYVPYYNLARPHQGLGQKTAVPAERPTEGEVVALSVLSGLHHEYRRAA